MLIRRLSDVENISGGAPVSSTVNYYNGLDSYGDNYYLDGKAYHDMSAEKQRRSQILEQALLGGDAIAKELLNTEGQYYKTGAGMDAFERRADELRRARSKSRFYGNYGF